MDDQPNQQNKSCCPKDSRDALFSSKALELEMRGDDRTSGQRWFGTPLNSLADYEGSFRLNYVFPEFILGTDAI